MVPDMSSNDNVDERSSTDESERNTSGQQPMDEEPTSPEALRQQISGDSIPILLLVDKLADRAEPLIDMVQSVAKQYKDSRKDRVAFRLHMTYAAIGLVLTIVSIAAGLTYLDKLDGSTFGFLLGLIIGYLLTFVRDAIGVTSTDDF